LTRRIGTWLTIMAIFFSTFTPLASAAYGPGQHNGDEVELVDGGAFAVTIGEHRTHFPSHGRFAGRAANVRLAAERLDGIVLEPGQALSFNESVGHRTQEEGFEFAPVIANGQIKRGVGGGVCQVATTLHVAAVTAGLTILERRAHSRPSHYVDAGMDATVVDGRVDYRIANPYDFPIAVRMKTTDSDDLLVVITGAERVSETAFHSRRVRVLPIRERRVVDPTLPTGAEVVDREGREGLVVRVVTERDGESHSEIVRYAPAPRIVRVGGPVAVGA
jgi:vancomycin resistance protein YoaR